MNKKEKKDLDLNLTIQQKFNFDSNDLDEEEIISQKMKKSSSKKDDLIKEITKEKNMYKKKLIVFFTLFIIMILISLIIVIYYNLNPKIEIKTIEKKVVSENIVFLGDSITEGYDLEKFYGNTFFIVNSGQSGNKTIDILNDMENRVYRYNPSKIIILIGTNDLESKIEINEIVANIKEIVKKIRKNRSNAKIYIESIYPINNTDIDKIDHDMVGVKSNEDIKKINNKLQKYCEKSNLTYIDIFSQLLDEDGNLNEIYTKDGLHLSDEGYKVVTENLKMYIN